ncbi:MAG: glycoside hydrolase family 10 protein [Faecalibacterium sp.]
MTQRRRLRKRRAFGRRVFLAGAGAALCGTGLFLRYHRMHSHTADAPQPGLQPDPSLPSGEWRAVWVSYLEWAQMDFSSEEAFRSGTARMLENCAALGLNTVIAQVRPFGDALYRSALYPWSHLCTGTQGADPGFDPLDVLITEAHARGLSLEAWVNPYRLRSSERMPPSLAPGNLANTHPEWVCAVNGGLYLNPAEPDAAAYVVRGVEELVQNYAVDGIHFDDYFYPTTDPALDAAQFAASGAQDLAAWRRENVTAMVKAARDAVKAADPTLRFGVSPQGNPDNDVGQQYSDVYAWLEAEGEDAVVDYLCPQIYWGYGYTLSTGSTRFAFERIVPEWLSMPRSGSVALYFGLGAWRVGTGDGGANEDSTAQWCTGSALARQVQDLRAQAAQGWALYRYGSLFGDGLPELAAAECAALAALDGTEAEKT